MNLYSTGDAWKRQVRKGDLVAILDWSDAFAFLGVVTETSEEGVKVALRMKDGEPESRELTKWERVRVILNLEQVDELQDVIDYYESRQ